MKYTYEYPRPMVTVDCVIFTKDTNELLLIKRKNDPYKDMWCFPGGYVDIDENLKDAANRELYEETGLKNIRLKQLKTFGSINRDPRGRTISVVFFGFSDTKEIESGDDAKDADWFDIQGLPDLGFDHSEILKCAIKMLYWDYNVDFED